MRGDVIAHQLLRNHRQQRAQQFSHSGTGSRVSNSILALQRHADQLGLLERKAKVQPICTADYPTPARRPSYSLLDCTATRTQLDLAPGHWRDALNDTLLHNQDGLQQLIQVAKA